MQQLVLDPIDLSQLLIPFPIPVLGIAGNGMSYRGQMGSNLMAAASHKMHLKKSHAIGGLQGAVGGEDLYRSPGQILSAFSQLHPIALLILIEKSLQAKRLCHLSLHQSVIELDRRAIAQDLREVLLSSERLTRQEQPRRIAVQAISHRWMKEAV